MSAFRQNALPEHARPAQHPGGGFRARSGRGAAEGPAVAARVPLPPRGAETPFLAVGALRGRGGRGPQGGTPKDG